MNLSDALEAYFKKISKRIRSLIITKTNEFLELPEKESLNKKKK
jgi:hypothetical protein